MQPDTGFGGPDAAGHRFRRRVLRVVTSGSRHSQWVRKAWRDHEGRNPHLASKFGVVVPLFAPAEGDSRRNSRSQLAIHANARVTTRVSYQWLGHNSRFVHPEKAGGCNRHRAHPCRPRTARPHQASRRPPLPAKHTNRDFQNLRFTRRAVFGILSLALASAP